MAVVDASVVVEMLLGTSIGSEAFDRLASDPVGAHAPHLVDIEVLHVLRRLDLIRELPATIIALAVEALPLLRLERHAHLLLLPRAWALRTSVSAYDAVYIALAEALDTPLITCDAKLSRSHGHRARVELLT
jgi:predicted nucleic acid-binding protein